MAEEAEDHGMDGVAVVGLAGRFPGAPSIERLWANLRAGTESVRRFTNDELRASGVPEELIADPSYVAARGLIDAPEAFDAAFFGISPREAELMDPQHRLFLETCWHGIENAGYAPRSVPGRVGVWGGMSTGMSNDTYLHSNLGGPNGMPEEDRLSVMLGSENDYLTTRVSYKLDLRGPSVNVQTACSTSLVAIVQAFESLMTYGCDMAVAGGVSVSYPQHAGYLHQEGGIGSPDGHCRPFDADAQGTVFSNGVGVAILKRLDEAIEDGDTILAVVRGAASNNDGAAKVSFAAPSADGQSAVIASAHAIAGFDPASISYVETHGTGTPIGDPIEVAGLTRAFTRPGDSAEIAPSSGPTTPHCALGSIKSNFGHLDSAAGIAGFIKTVLCLHHRTLVPTVHFQTPSPRIEWEGSPFYVNRETRPWPAGPSPRRAGVSAFGIGGTNAHVVLEEAPRRTPVAAGRVADVEVLPLSARSPDALGVAIRKLGERLAADSGLVLADVAHTLQVGREAFQHRAALVATDREQAADTLVRGDRARLVYGDTDGTTPEVVFLLPGGGAQYVGMAKGLYATHAAFRADVDRGLALLNEREDLDLGSSWFADAADPAAARDFERPSVQLPAIFIVEVALARLLKRWGFEPSAMIGHSMGENTAACLAGVMTYEDALGLVALRGRLFDSAAPGGMLSVTGAWEHVEARLGDHLDLAAVNAPDQCTVSGPMAALESLRAELEAEDIDVRVVPIDIAAHSRLVEPLLGPFGDYLRTLDLKPPRVPFLSNLTGSWITDAEATDPEYWVAHLRNTVRYADNVRTVIDERRPFFLEVGPGRILSSLAKLCEPSLVARSAATMRHPREEAVDDEALMSAVARSWVAGVEVDWARIREDAPVRRVPLPGYPFERRRYFIEPQTVTTPGRGSRGSEAVPTSDEEGSRGEDQASGATGVEIEEEWASREDRIVARVRAILHELSGIELAAIDPDRSFLDMGFDSLGLTQANLRFRRVFKVKVTFRQLFDEAPTPRALAAFLDQQMDPDAFPVGGASDERAPSTPSPTGASFGAAGDTGVPEPDATRVGPYRPMQRVISTAVDTAQQAYLDDFLTRYEARTARSKAFTAEHRPHFADPRAVAGFKSAFKEITYPIVAERSKGSKVWDLDGNEYVDLAGGFGATFFGHAPDFVMDAVRRQTEVTVDYGPQSALAPETARLIAEMTGQDRATFCNTGSEAVLAAMRIARTVTGRDLIVTFAGSYHGIFNEVLVKSRMVGGERRNFPAAPGIPASSNQNLLVLDYGDPASLRIIEERADELAAVLVEPIQSRRPELQPGDFVRELRRITRDVDVPLIFDEIITGFRLHPQGAQAWYGVDSDIGCYGKVVGGGMPVGVVAGKARFMDALDGGPWQYGDDSFPEAGVTYFAGTFIRHPLAVAAVRAVLEHLQAEGPELQAALNRRTAVFCEGVNRAYRRLGVPIELTYFSSVILPRFRGNSDFEGLFFHHLRYCGIHVWEGRPGFLSTAHDEADFTRLTDGFVEAASRMREAGFFADSRPAEQLFEWTPAQSELWVAFQMGDDASAAYNEQVVFELGGAIDEEALELALDKVCNRHESLRSVVRPDENGLVVRPYLAPEFSTVDIAALPAEARAGEVERLLRDLIDRPFDFKQGPLSRACLIREAPRRHRLALTVSHLVCDGWSLEVVMQDLARDYTAIVQSRQVAHTAPPTLRDYMAVEQERAEAETREARAYWLEVFDDLPAVSELPLDHPRPAIKSYRGERQAFALEPGLSALVGDYARAAGCTKFAVLLAAHVSLIHRLTGSRDLVIGIPAAGHPNLGLTELVAHTVNLLPVRVSVAPGASFETLLASVKDAFNDAKSYQDYGYGMLLQDLSIPRDPSRLPLLDATFNMDLEFAPILFEDTRAEFQVTPRSYVKYDLHFNLLDKGDDIDLEVDRNADLFDAETVVQWVRAYERILKDSIAHPDGAVAVAGGDPLPGARGPLVESRINADAPASFPQTVPLHARFEQQVRETPQATALTCGDEQWSYAELNARANTVAARLIEAGTAPAARVGLCAERSLDLMAGLLGILKAGAAYVPLDPRQPRERLSAIVDDAEPTAVLAHPGVRDVLPPIEGPILSLMVEPDSGWRDAPNPDPRGTPDSEAYVLFTSGSTGRPKGVMVTHRNVLRLVDGVQHWFQFTSADVWSLFHSYAFDVSVFEMWGAFLHGARLVVVPHDVSRDPALFRALLARERVSVLSQTPSAFLQLQREEAEHEDRLPLRQVIFAGEALAPASLLPWVEKYGTSSPQLINMYGITETTVHATYRPLTEDDVRSGAPSFIGQPIPDLVLYVVDDDGVPVPVGREGELWVGGGGVTNGYVGRPDLTAERFIDNPFGEGVLYRSGDRVRATPAGDLEYLGRRDEQVQVRGFRVELGEVEAALTRCEGVSQAVVTVRVDDYGFTNLVGYYVPVSETPLDPGAVRSALRDRVPDYMMPGHLVALEEIPLNHSGKIDRARLPDPETRQAVGGLIPPATEAERYLLEVWREALSMPQISVDDNFFDIGGHSLLAVQVAARVNAERGVRLPLREMISGTLRTLADRHLEGPSEPSTTDGRQSDEEVAGAETEGGSGLARVWKWAAERVSRD